MTDILRHATLDDIVTVLNSNRSRTVDLVVKGSALNYTGGQVKVTGQQPLKLIDPVVTEDGVTTEIDPNGAYLPTAHGDASMGDALGIPARYVRKLREAGRTDLLDANVRGLLRGKMSTTADGGMDVLHAPDGRSFLLRLLTGQDGQPGVLRAFLSDRFGVIDNLDVLTAVLDGVRQAGVEVQVRDADLSDTRMHVRLVAPGVTALAPQLLNGYRNPWDNQNLRGQLERNVSDLNAWRRAARDEGLGFDAGREPIVSAGLTLDNSEVGAGALRLAFQIVVLVCKNGLTMPIQLRKVHLGGQLDEGIVWGREVQAQQLKLVTKQVQQAVSEWMTPAFLAAQVDKVEAAAGAPVTDAEAVVKAVATRYKFSEAERNGVLAHFMSGGQATAAGIANAITSYSQTVSADRAEELDSIAVSAMTLVK
jgi:hypothetical protein